MGERYDGTLREELLSGEPHRCNGTEAAAGNLKNYSQSLRENLRLVNWDRTTCASSHSEEERSVRMRTR